MSTFDRIKTVVPLLLLVVMLASLPAYSQGGTGAAGGGQQYKPSSFGPSTDLVGEYYNTHFGGRNSQLANYMGVPLNEAGRLRAETFDGTEWDLPQMQCQPHSMVHQWRAAGSLRVEKEIDPVNRDIRAYHFSWTRSLPRPVYMDGRPHPPEDAPHTWSGFSTGKFVGDTLVVTTTHLKENDLHRAGPFYSDKTTVTEYINRIGDDLIVTVFVQDPIYLSEPMMETGTWRWFPHKEMDYYPCTRVEGEWDELSIQAVPHYLPGENPNLREYSEKVGIPYEATRGGAETMYPEYLEKLKTLK